MLARTKWYKIPALLCCLVVQCLYGDIAVAFETPGSIFEFDANLDLGGDAVWTETGAFATETLTFVGAATPTATQVSDGTLNLFAHNIGADGQSNVFEQALGGVGQASRRSGTFEVWFKPNDLTTADQIIQETGGGGRGTILSLSNNNLEFLANGDNDTTISTTLTNTNWHQVVGIVHNSGGQDNLANDFVSLYLNGAFVGDTSASLVELDDWAGGNQGGLGSFGGASHPSGGQIAGTNTGADFSGNLHLYRYYDQALDASQILANYNAVVNPASQWTADANGIWSSGTNWASNPDVPGLGALSGRDAILGAVATAPRTISLDTNVNLSGLGFQNENSYTIAGGGGTMTLSGSAEVRVSSGTHIIGATINGSDGLLKTGGGTLELSGSNNFTGTVGLNGGALAVAGNPELGNAANNLEFNGGALRVDGSTFSSLSRPLVFTGNGTINVAEPSNTVNVTSAPIGSGALVKAGAGGLQLSNAALFAGNISVNGGTLIVSNSGGLGSTSGTTQIGEAGGTVELDGSAGNLTIGENFNRLLSRFNAVPEAHIRNTAGNNSLTGTVEAGGGAFGNARFENTASGTTLTINNKISHFQEDTNFNFVFQGTGNFQVGNA